MLERMRTHAISQANTTETWAIQPSFKSPSVMAITDFLEEEGPLYTSLNFDSSMPSQIISHSRKFSLAVLEALVENFIQDLNLGFSEERLVFHF